MKREKEKKQQVFFSILFLLQRREGKADSQQVMEVVKVVF